MTKRHTPPLKVKPGQPLTYENWPPPAPKSDISQIVEPRAHQPAPESEDPT